MVIDRDAEDRVTQDFALSEFLVSETALRWHIDNTPPPPIMATLRNVLIPGMQRVRDLLGVPVVILSGYRCPELNRAVRGAATSQHMEGTACDFVASRFGTPRKVAAFLAARAATLKFDQLIYEGSWVHISFTAQPRRDVLTAHFGGGGVTYTMGIG